MNQAGLTRWGQPSQPVDTGGAVPSGRVRLDAENWRSASNPLGSLAEGLITLLWFGRDMEYSNLPDPKKPRKSDSASPPRDAQTGRRARRAEEANSQPVSGLRGWFRRIVVGDLEEPAPDGVIDERESSRLPVTIPVTLCGVDEDGQPFRESTRTVNVSKRGARIVTLHDLPPDTHVWIENPGVGRISIAKVIRSGKGVDPQEATEICVKVLELLDPEKIWDIQSPPADWVRGFEPPSASHRLEYLLARERLARPEILSYGAVETTVPKAKPGEKADEPMPLPGSGTASAEMQADVGPASTPSNPNIAAPPGEAREVPATVSAEAEEIAVRARPRSGPSRTEESHELGSAIAGSGVREGAQSLETGARDSHKVAEAAINSINSAVAEAIAQLKASQLRTEAEVASRAEAVQNRLTELSTSTEGVERRSEVVLEEFQKRLAETLKAFQEKGAAQADDLAKAAQDVVDRAARQLKEQNERASRETAAARDSIHLASEQARAQLEAARAEIEVSYTARAEAHEKRMAELSSALERLEQQAGALLERFEGSLEDALQAFQQKGSAGQADLEMAAQSLLESSKAKLQGHADATVAGLGEKARATLAMTAEEARKQVASTQQLLESLGRTAGERFDQRLAMKSKEHAEIAGRASEATVNSINLSAERAVSRLQATEKRIEEGFSSWAGLFQTRLAELFAGMEGLERHSETLLRDFQDKLELALQQFLDRKNAEANDLQEASRDMVERLARQVNEQAEAVVERLREEAEAVVRSVEEESQTHLDNANKALESAARAATELYAHRLARTSAEQSERAWLNADEVARSISLNAEESAARLEAAQKKMEAGFAALVEAHETRMTEISSSLEEIEKRSEAILEDLRQRLRDASPTAQPEESPDFPEEKAAGAN